MDKPQKREVKILNHQLQFPGNRNFNWTVVGPVSNQVLIGKLVRALINMNFY